MKVIKTYSFLRDIKLVPLCDIHVGSNFFDEKSFKETVEYIKKNKRVYWFIDGDCIENIVPGKYDPYDQNLTPYEQVEKLIQLLEPIKHRGLFAFNGNHVSRTKKSSFFDLMKTISDRLDIDYLGVGGYVNMEVGSENYMLAIQHGSTGGTTKAGSYSELHKMKEVYCDADIYLLGHNHDLDFTIEPIISVNKSKNKEVIKPVYVGRTGSYLGYADYARERLYSPKLQGSLSINFSDGDKKISCRKLIYLNSKALWK